MILWWAVLIAIFNAVKLKTCWRNNTYWRLLQNHFNSLYTPVDLYEHVKYIQVQRTNSTFSSRPSNILLENFEEKNMGARTLDNQELRLYQSTQETMRIAKKYCRYLSYKCFSPICFYRYSIINRNDDISSVDDFENSKISKGSF